MRQQGLHDLVQAMFGILQEPLTHVHNRLFWRRCSRFIDDRPVPCLSPVFVLFLTTLSRRTRHPAVDQQLLQQVSRDLLFEMLSQTLLVCVVQIV